MKNYDYYKSLFLEGECLSKNDVEKLKDEYNQNRLSFIKAIKSDIAKNISKNIAIYKALVFLGFMLGNLLFFYFKMDISVSLSIGCVLFLISLPFKIKEIKYQSSFHDSVNFIINKNFPKNAFDNVLNSTLLDELDLNVLQISTYINSVKQKDRELINIEFDYLKEC